MTRYIVAVTIVFVLGVCGILYSQEGTHSAASAALTASAPILYSHGGTHPLCRHAGTGTQHCHSNSFTCAGETQVGMC